MGGQAKEINPPRPKSESVRIPSPHPFLRTPSKLHFENILSERGRFLPTQERSRVPPSRCHGRGAKIHSLFCSKKVRASFKTHHHFSFIAFCSASTFAEATADRSLEPMALACGGKFKSNSYCF